VNIPLCRADIREEDINRVIDCLRSGWITSGPLVSKFEEAFAAFKGIPCQHVHAVSSCTAALHLSLLSAGISPGDEVITTALTFSATVHEIVHVGAIPVLVDIDPNDWNIDITRIEAAITPATRAILVVHYAGRPCNMDTICDIAKAHGLKLIEDCAHAIETKYHGGSAGTFGDFSAFSFYASKNLTTAEGGALIARNPEDITRTRIMSLHGMDRDAWARGKDNKFSYLVVSEGYKYNLSDVHAGIGIGQIGRLTENWHRRAHRWEQYINAFNDLPVRLPAPLADTSDTHAYHIFTMCVMDGEAKRNQLMSYLKQAGVSSSIHYPPIAVHPYFQKRFHWQPDQYPVALAYGQSTITLPLFPGMTDREVEYIISTVRAFFRKTPATDSK